MNVLQVMIPELNFNFPILMDDSGEKRFCVTPICEAIGVVAHKQAARILKDPRFKTHQLVGEGSDGRKCKMVTLPLRQLEAFLFTINPRSTMNPDVKRRLLSFQQCIVDLIHCAFNSETLSNPVIKMLKDEIQELRQLVGEQAEIIRKFTWQKSAEEKHTKLVSAASGVMRLNQKRNLALVA